MNVKKELEPAVLAIRALRSGNKFNDKKLELIKDIVKRNHNLSCKEISAVLLNEHQINCSKWSVRRYLQKLGFSFKKPIVKPLLTKEHEFSRSSAKRVFN